jgi:exonuclease SbcC
MMKEIFHLQRFDLASKVAQQVPENTVGSTKALSGFEAISKETISALEEEVVAANTELQTNKTELELVETESQNDHFKTNFEDLEENPPFYFYRTKPKWMRYKPRSMRLKSQTKL